MSFRKRFAGFLIASTFLLAPSLGFSPGLSGLPSAGLPSAGLPAALLPSAHGAEVARTVPHTSVAPTSVALSLSMPANADTQVWLPPVEFPVRVGRAFDPPEMRWLAGHRGVDLCPGVGTQIRAPRAGTVVYAGKLADRNVVSIRHSDGLHSTFEPVDPAVRRGSTVPAGAVVGTLEAGHDGDCLHWGVKVNRDLYLNPLSLLLGTPVLKPWDGPA